ncbi:MAG: phytanoyl-CoA dioxygenase family protein [Candidatus Latescibacterota bacterium]|nr:phytanoyl-CoA dioxygenase family protein [Candidatus Latescibacterota bacterium]
MTNDDIIKQIDERGFCCVPNVISVEKADEACNVLDELLANEITEDIRAAQTQRVGKIIVKHKIFLELMCHPFVVNLWGKYLGDDLICGTFSANTVYPGKKDIGWHADYPYWSIKPPWPPGRFAVQTLWMLSDFTKENGATASVPGSHLKGHPPDGNTGEEREDEEILTGKRGSVVFAHGAWWHTARPNLSNHSRSCLLGMYMKPCFIPQEDMLGQLNELKSPSEITQQLLGNNQHKPRNVGD